MIGNVLPVQLNVPQRKDKQLELQSKEEQTSFSEKMNEKAVKEQKPQKIEKNEVPKEIQQSAQQRNKMNKKESFVPKEETEEKKEIEELLVAISGQMFSIAQLHAQPELLYQYIQKIQELYKTYGNMKLNELPPTELQQLVAFLKDFNIENTICLEDTMQVTLEKLAAPEKMMELAKAVQSETFDLSKKDILEEATIAQKKAISQEVTIAGEKNISQEATIAIKKNVPEETITAIKKENQGKLIELGDTDVQLTTGEQHVKPILLGNDQVVKENIPTQKVALPDLGKNMEAQVAELQKFVVKQERVLFQLNPEKLGTLTVYMKKQGDQIQVHVEMDKHEVKKKVEIIFDELKNKLRDKEIHIELSYTDKEQKREQHEREQPHKQKQMAAKEEQKAEKDFAGLLEE
ncbi:flagellar hook-length control protein FliK [Bacillus sp. S14(2024)]|uniref:flagellar hook-length control protein FliK n=1 Tax=Bacillus sp. S14(2024) TaxID=3162884 RepID=UPI003D22FAB8